MTNRYHSLSDYCFGLTVRLWPARCVCCVYACEFVSWLVENGLSHGWRDSAKSHLCRGRLLVAMLCHVYSKLWSAFPRVISKHSWWETPSGSPDYYSDILKSLTTQCYQLLSWIFLLKSELFWLLLLYVVLLQLLNMPILKWKCFRNEILSGKVDIKRKNKVKSGCFSSK